VRAAFALLLIAGAAFAQVQNAADAPAGVYTVSALAPGSRAVVSYASNSGASPGSATVSLLPVNSTTPLPAQVIGVTSSAITFVVPQGIPNGPAQLIYKPGGQATQWTTVTIAPASFSLYRTGPVGPLIAPIVNLAGSGYPSGLTTPAQPGFGVEIFGSGLGATPLSQVHITLGGVSQQVFYAGAPPQMPGINQINFLVAPGTPDGCYVPLVLTYGTQSVSSFLSKTSDGMPCHHPWGLSTQALKILDSGGSVNTAEIQLTTGIDAATSSRASRQESAQIVSTFLLNAGQIAQSFPAMPGNPAQPCSLVTASGVGSSFIGGIGYSGLAGQLVHSGIALTLPYTSSQTTDSPLSSLPPPVIAAGPWTFTATDGSGLPAGSTFPFTLPPPIQLSGGAPIVINHAQNSTVTWDGSGYDAFATLQLSLTSALAPGVSCTIPAQAGGVTVPANLLASFSAGSAGALSVTVSENGAGIPAADFTVNGAPVLGLALWSSSDTRPVDFQ
jgi:uncharacterized protein (TIGR03437 family)